MAIFLWVTLDETLIDSIQLFFLLFEILFRRGEELLESGSLLVGHDSASLLLVGGLAIIMVVGVLGVDMDERCYFADA